jgi:anti-sigma28 factor (negative regulator of flagellin synthesis)
MKNKDFQLIAEAYNQVVGKDKHIIAALKQEIKNCTDEEEKKKLEAKLAKYESELASVKESYSPGDVIYLADLESHIEELKTNITNGTRYETELVDGQPALVKTNPMAGIEAKRSQRLASNPSLYTNKDLPR